MSCAKCGTANPVEAKFCMKCGSPLKAACSNCRTELPSGAKFCFNCGQQVTGKSVEAKQETGTSGQRTQQYIPPEMRTKLESARSAGSMQGERRVVTMLFCDVQGSTAAAEKLDPEEWAQIMNGAFEHLIGPVYKYEGTLARLLGDAILAFFGAPIAHEDDPQRALLSAMEILDAIGPYREKIKKQWGFDFNVRIGINTGLVVVGAVGSDLRVEYTALGDAVNLAARMEQTAKAGTIQITENTHRLVAPLFDFEDLGLNQVKGKAEPVRSYRLVGKKARPGQLRGIEGLYSPMVGREGEKQRLLEAVADLRRGRGQIVSVQGEAGLGKSRLVSELRQSLGLASDDSAQDSLSWYEGRSLSYETATPYAPITRLLRDCLGIKEDQTQEEQYQQIRSSLNQLLQNQSESVVPYIATFFGFQLSREDVEQIRYLQPSQIKSGLHGAISKIFEAAASRRPVVLVCEDLHWSDSASLEFLEELMKLTDRAAVMVVGVFRPGREEPSWRFHEVAERDYTHRYTSIVLQPLKEEDARSLVSNLLYIEGLPEKVRKLILDKSEGNPFFVEEVIRSLLDANLVVRDGDHWRATHEVENIAVPDTLAGVITARMDRLDEGARRALQTASVIGREFQFDSLSSIYGAEDSLEDRLSELQRRGLVREKSRFPELAYVFKHALTQETAYSSLLLSKRRELHGKVAEYLEEKAPDSVNEIGRHFLEAQEPRRALPYLVAAGEKASRSYSIQEAGNLFSKALEIVEEDTEISLARRAFEGMGTVLSFSFRVPEAVAVYQKMYDYGTARNNDPIRVSALNKLGFTKSFMMGQLAEGEELLASAENLAKGCGDVQGLAEVHMMYCSLKVSLGDLDGALDHQKESFELGQKMDMVESRLFGMVHTSNTLMFLTRFDEGWEAAGNALRNVEAEGHKGYKSDLLTFAIPIYHLRNGEIDKAYDTVKEGTDLANSIGAVASECTGDIIMGQIHLMRGEYEQAIGASERALAAARVAEYPFMLASALCVLGMAYLGISEKFIAKTNEYHAQALKMLEMPLGNAMGAMNWVDLGFCAMAQEAYDSANDYFQKGLTISTGMKYLSRPELLIGSALVAIKRGELTAASKCIEEARQIVEEHSMKHLYPMVYLAEGRLKMMKGETAGALEVLARAESLAEGMNMRPVMLQAKLALAGALAALLRHHEGESKRKEARVAVEEMTRFFADDALKLAFLESANKKLTSLS